MKNLTLFLLILFNTFIIDAQNSSCLNGDFESNSFSNWTGYFGQRNSNGINVNNLVPTFNSQRHKITSSGFDPNVGGSLLSMVGEGQHSARLGDALTPNEHGDALKYTFTVDNNNKNFGFKYAIVLKDGNHHPEKKNPFFSYIIFVGQQPTTFNLIFHKIQEKKWIADLNDPFFKKSGSSVVWRDWSTECIDLSNYIGQTVSIMFFSADCSEGEHFGYAYIDGLCSNDNNAVADFDIKQDVCINEPLVADASNSVNEDNYFWSIQESDYYWNRYGEEYYKWYVAESAGLFDLRSFIESKGGELKCNTYYRVKLAVQSNCTNWNDITKLVYVRCPVDDLPDIFVCCGEEEIKVGPFGKEDYYKGYKYEWSTSPVALTKLGESDTYLTLTNPQNTTVTVTVTDQFACSYTQEIDVKIIDDFEISISSIDAGDCCSQTLKANVIFKNECNNFENYSEEEKNKILSLIDFEWSNGQKTQAISLIGQSELLYSVNAKFLNCFSHSDSYLYVPKGNYYPNGYNGAFIAPSGLWLSGNDQINKLVIMEYSPDAPYLGEPDAYGITGYRLRIYDRWGDVFVEKTEVDRCEFNQGDIFWDGKDSYGNNAKEGTYTYTLEIMTCSNKSWQKVCNITTNSDMVNQGDCIFECWSWVEPFMQWYCCSTFSDDCGYAITVLE